MWYFDDNADEYLSFKSCSYLIQVLYSLILYSLSTSYDLPTVQSYLKLARKFSGVVEIIALQLNSLS